MSFDAAFTRTIGAEGGYSNNPTDPGGETNWGITAAVAGRHGYQGAMKDLPMLEARNIYCQDYWNLLHLPELDAISAPIAEEMFDIAVNCGQGVPVPFLQRALNTFNRQGRDFPDLAVDGLVGSATLAALKSFLARRGARGEKVILAALNAQQGVRYFDIAEKRPKLEDFEFGWWDKRIVAPT